MNEMIASLKEPALEAPAVAETEEQREFAILQANTGTYLALAYFESISNLYEIAPLTLLDKMQTLVKEKYGNG